MSRMSDAFKRIPRTDTQRALNSRALVLCAMFREGWPSHAGARPTLAQVRVILAADAAMTRAQRARDSRIAAEET